MPSKETGNMGTREIPKIPKIPSLADIAKKRNPNGSETMFGPAKKMNPNPGPEMFAPESPNGLPPHKDFNSAELGDILAELKNSESGDGYDSDAKTVYGTGEPEYKQSESRQPKPKQSESKPAPVPLKDRIESIIKSPMVNNLKKGFFTGLNGLLILFLGLTAMLKIYNPITSSGKRIRSG